MYLFEFAQDEKFYSLKETAAVLGVSEATVRNWTRANILISQRHGRRLIFFKNEVDKLNSQIIKGAVKRLTSRANKNRRTTSRRHNELGDKRFLQQISELARVVHERTGNVRATLCDLARTFAVWSGLEHTAHLIEREICENEVQFDHRFVLPEITPFRVSDYSLAFSIAFQHLSSDGYKAKKGAIYTPPNIANEICTDFIKTRLSFIDPCCGSGIFLTAAIRRMKLLGINDWHDYIVGCDIDGDAVLCARLSCLFEAEEQDGISNADIQIFQDDALTSSRLSELYGHFDLVATNPPWGAKFSSDRTDLYRKRYPLISTGESFSYFTALAFRLLKCEGRYSFLLPESVLTTNYHRDIRSVLLNKRSLEIRDMNRPFYGLLTNVVRVDAINSENNDGFVVVHRPDSKEKISLSKVKQNSDLVVSIASTTSQMEVLEKIKSKEGFTLSKNAVWALGIVTGNNSKFVKSVSEPGLEPVYRGKDVSPYRLGRAGSFIRFERGLFQQCADERIYRAPQKLVYKFISKNLCFALDTTGSLTLNSANIVIPDQNENIYFILAALNSKYANFYFRVMFNSVKVLRKHIESIPIPRLSDNKYEEVAEYARLAIRADDPSLYREKIDKVFNDYYGVSDDDLLV